MSPTQSYTQRIRFLKRVLPLLAIAVLIMVFFVNWERDERISNLFNETERGFEDPDLVITNPQVEVEEANGDRVLLGAETLSQLDLSTQKVEGEKIDSTITNLDSEWRISSERGVADIANSNYQFEENAEAVIDEEITIQSEALEASTDENRIRSDSTIEVTSEDFGVVADQGEMSGTKGERVFSFVGNVEGFFMIEVGE